MYDRGIGSKGIICLHTLGIKNGYNVIFTIDQGKSSAKEIEEKNKATPLGLAVAKSGDDQRDKKSDDEQTDKKDDDNSPSPADDDDEESSSEDGENSEEKQ